MKVFRRLSARVLLFGLLGVVAAGISVPASAQTSEASDFTQFGFSQVVGTANFTPGQATTLTAGNQKVDIPADFMSKPVKFEFLEGDPSFFAGGVGSDDMIVATFAFRVTDESTGQLVEKFDKSVMWSITDPAITSKSEVYDTSASNPPKVTDNPEPSTIQGNTLSHTFDGADDGWLVISPALTAGMPTTGNSIMGELPLALLAGAVVLAGGLAVRRRAKVRA